MKTHQPKFNFRTLKEHVPISYILFAYGLDKNLKQRGAKLFGACPLHGGDNPTAFRVNLERGLWHCFTVCGGGDIVDLVRRIECCDYAQAAQYLHRLACSLKAKRQMLSMNLSTSEPSYTTCVHPPRQTSFIPFRRQIPLNPKNSFLQQQKGITVRTALRYEAGWSNRSAFLQGMIAVHLHNLKGAPLGYAGRRLSSDDIRHCGKWRFPPHFPKAELLFNAHRVAAKRDQGVVLVECPWAAMRIAQAGFLNAVALLGTTLSEVQTSWLSQAPVVLVMLDGDNAGRKASLIIARALWAKTRVSVFNLPDGKEPEDLSDSVLASITQAFLSF